MTDLLFGTGSAFFEGSVAEAVAKADAEGVLIVVYIHSINDAMAHVFSDEMVIEHLKEPVGISRMLF